MTGVRAATPTVACIDEYCAHYRSVFHNVRHFEQFTQLILGLLAETKRKSLPRLAKTVQSDHQALHHFLANAPVVDRGAPRHSAAPDTPSAGRTSRDAV